MQKLHGRCGVIKMFIPTLTTKDLMSYVTRQLNNMFPDKLIRTNDKLFIRSMNEALERTEYCFKHVAMKSYHVEGTTFFSHLHADQYTIFLWFLSNASWKIFEDVDVSSKLFYLNKAINGVISMYDANLPDIFLIIHGGNVVLGKATYNDFFVCYQGSTVGAIEGKYPTLGKGVAMAPHSSIIGPCIVGDRVTLGNQSLLRNRNLKSDTLYYRHIETGQHVTQQTEEFWAQTFFNVPIFK